MTLDDLRGLTSGGRLEPAPYPSSHSGYSGLCSRAHTFTAVRVPAPLTGCCQCWQQSSSRSSIISEVSGTSRWARWRQARCCP
jgi:hypothetical protein